MTTPTFVFKVLFSCVQTIHQLKETDRELLIRRKYIEKFFANSEFVEPGEGDVLVGDLRFVFLFLVIKHALFPFFSSLFQIYTCSVDTVFQRSARLIEVI